MLALLQDSHQDVVDDCTEGESQDEHIACDALCSQEHGDIEWGGEGDVLIS